MQQKVNTVLHLRGKIIESERVMESQKVDAEADKKFKKALLDNDINTTDENKKDVKPSEPIKETFLAKEQN